jgi:hypothetical protein
LDAQRHYDIRTVQELLGHKDVKLLDLQSLTTTFQHLKWRERIKTSFGYDRLECPRCGCALQLAEIWEPNRGHIWMRRWLLSIASDTTPCV